MERPILEYAENCTLIYTYARKLEEYCDELEECNNIVCSDMENLRESLDYELQVKIEKIERLEKALDRACDVIVELNTCNNLISEEYLHCPLEQKCNNRCIEEKCNNRCISNKEEWKEWCMKL